MANDTLETAFAIGRPARSAAHKTCSRCKGTGWWQLARLCFKCGGVGHAEVSTKATRIRDKCAHILEVEGLLADDIRRRGIIRFGKRQHEEHIANHEANLARLRAELADLEAA